VRTIDAEPRDSSDGDPMVRGEITLVGVVHDHPASTYRARTIATAAEPDVLALELPPLAVPLFERYADDETEPPELGGEMSAAIQASDAERTAGIDGPSVGFGVRLARHVVAEERSLSTARTALDRFARASGHALKCRAASMLAAATDRLPDLSARREHAVTAADDPIEQAEDEARQVRLARSVAAALGADRAVATRDETREAHMAARLQRLAAEGDVVAVVGIDHVEAVADRLLERERAS